jgi:hypothetical protein
MGPISWNVTLPFAGKANTLAYQAQSLVLKKRKFFEYDPWDRIHNTFYLCNLRMGLISWNITFPLARKAY